MDRSPEVSLSALLFHGPGAREEAVEASTREGLPIDDPIGDEGLKTDDVRELVIRLRAPAVGSQRGTLVIGPVDGIPVSAADAMLKTIEEVRPDGTLPILWARDAGRVLPTIVSRCLVTWCPAGADPDLPYMEAADKLVRAALTNKWGTAIEILGEHKGNEYEVLSATASVLSQARGDTWIPLWLAIREVLCSTHISKTEAVSALMWRVR